MNDSLPDYRPRSILPAAENGCGQTPPSPSEAGDSLLSVEIARRRVQWFLALLGLVGAVGALVLICNTLILMGDWAPLYFVALTCTVLVVRRQDWQPAAERFVSELYGGPKASCKPEVVRSRWRSWLYYTWMGIVFAFAAPIARQVIDPQSKPTPLTPVNQYDSIELAQRQLATVQYWRTAVADLHLARFRFPAEAGAAQHAFEQVRQQLQLKIDHASSARTWNVDSQLTVMVAKHLEQDRKMLKILDQIPELLKDYGLDWGTETIDQRAALWNEVKEKVSAQPELLSKLPPQVQKLVHELIEIEQQQQLQLREIEILQAVLQERYKGSTFSLPDITP